MGYDFMGSDIKINYAEKNAIWRKTHKFCTQDKEFTIFNHNIKENLGNQLEGKDVLVVTE